jgi:hypothetical protein
MDAAWRSRRPRAALQLTRVARVALQDRVHFENRFQLDMHSDLWVRRLKAVPCYRCFCYTPIQ